MPFDNSLTLLARWMVVLARKVFRLRTIESGMHAGDVLQRLRNFYPARQHGDIGNEADITHELVAFTPGVAAEHLQLSLVRGETQDGVERRRLAGAIGTDESKDAALFHTQIEAVQRDGCAEGLAEAASFYACHGQRSSSGGFDLIFDFEASGDERPLAPFRSSFADRPSR